MKKELTLFVLGICILSFVVMDVTWWIQISADDSKSLEQVNKDYLRKFPDFITNGKQVVILNILLLFISSFCFLKFAKLKKVKTLSIALIIFNMTVALWQIFTLS